MLLPVVPITTDEAQPHVRFEEVTGLAVRFAVATSAVIATAVTNPAERTKQSSFAQASPRTASKGGAAHQIATPCHGGSGDD